MSLSRKVLSLNKIMKKLGISFNICNGSGYLFVYWDLFILFLPLSLSLLLILLINSRLTSEKYVL